MLSDEEKKAIEYLKIEYEKLMKEDNILFPLYKSNAKRLIDIIEKQSKEIEEYKKQLDLDNECEIALNNKVMDLEKENEELKVTLEKEKQYRKGLISTSKKVADKLWEDKIKAKMEELDNPLSETFKSLLNAEEPTWSGTIKQFLQSLLEKE